MLVGLKVQRIARCYLFYQVFFSLFSCIIHSTSARFNSVRLLTCFQQQKPLLSFSFSLSSSFSLFPNRFDQPFLINIFIKKFEKFPLDPPSLSLTLLKNKNENNNKSKNLTLNIYYYSSTFTSINGFTLSFFFFFFYQISNLIIS